MWWHQHKQIQLGDVTYFYHEEGVGHPFIFLHGNRQSHQVFTKQIDYFKHYFRVLALDSRGHGRSGWGRYPLTIQTLAIDVHQLIDTLQLKQCYLLGFSDGGNIALKFATIQDQDLAAMIIISANLTPSALDRVIRIGSEIFSKMLHGLGHWLRWAQQQADKFDLMLHSTGVSMEDLESIQVPTLLVTGEDDIIDRQHIYEMATHLPHAQVVVLHNVGHNAIKQVPDQLNRLILHFIYEIRH